MKKVYYYLSIEQISPLRIGNGLHDETDSDLMLDGRGLPFIPGTSLAGVFRHRAVAMGMSEDIEKRLFGIVMHSKNKNDMPIIEKSSILFNDAVLPEGTPASKVVYDRRDGVGLGEWGSAKKGAKFDFQISETDCNFCSFIEWTGNDVQYENEIEKIIEPVLKDYIADGIKVGARTSRGYGKCKLSVRKKVFDFPNDLDVWMNDFDPYRIEQYDDKEMIGEYCTDSIKVKVVFKIAGTFSVRVNTAKTELAEDGSLPDSMPMENYKGNPVIPGTAWVGTFRHHMHDLLRDVGIEEKSREMSDLDALFGMASDVGSSGKSKLIFSETEIIINNKKQQKYSMVRTAIDRFTAAPQNAALFTSMVYSGGNGVLEIEFKKNDVEKNYIELLAACICDLHLGLISIGGEASVGKGIMSVEKVMVNGKDKTQQMKYSIKGESLEWLKGDD